MPIRSQLCWVTLRQASDAGSVDRTGLLLKKTSVSDPPKSPLKGGLPDQSPFFPNKVPLSPTFSGEFRGIETKFAID
jgi:hypothetical protein